MNDVKYWTVFRNLLLALGLKVILDLFCVILRGKKLTIFNDQNLAYSSCQMLVLMHFLLILMFGCRPLIATKATAPVASGKPKFAGHICIEKHRLQLHRSHQMEDIVRN